MPPCDSNLFCGILFLFLVSILVLVDAALRQHRLCGVSQFLPVSILVLVDAALRLFDATT